MIEEARVDSITMQTTTQYFVSVRLKEEYHAEYEKLTGDNIGNLLGVIYNEELISPTFPAIQTKIKGGGFSIGDYKEKEEAIEVKKQILSEDE